MSPSDGQYLVTVQIDERSLSHVSRDQEQERQVAIFDLLAQNHFSPVPGGRGPFDLGLSLIDGRLALDMSRRALHDEGSLLLQGRLDGKVEVDMPTARRLFTLICALHRRSA